MVFNDYTEGKMSWRHCTKWKAKGAEGLCWEWIRFVSFYRLPLIFRFLETTIFSQRFSFLEAFGHNAARPQPQHKSPKTAEGTHVSALMDAARRLAFKLSNTGGSDTDVPNQHV